MASPLRPSPYPIPNGSSAQCPSSVRAAAVMPRASSASLVPRPAKRTTCARRVLSPLTISSASSRPAMNPAPDSKADARLTYVACAAGADLAALVKLLAARLAAEPASSFLVFYGNYGEVNDTALEELLALKDEHLERLALHFIMDREPEEGELLNGRLDAHKLHLLAQELFD